MAADVCAIADWIVRILLGLFSVWLYRNTSKKNIDKIYSEYPEGDARTDALLQKGGYCVTLLQPVDMFPHTEHIENIAVLERRSTR